MAKNDTSQLSFTQLYRSTAINRWSSGVVAPCWPLEADVQPAHIASARGLRCWDEAEQLSCRSGESVEFKLYISIGSVIKNLPQANTHIDPYVLYRYIDIHTCVHNPKKHRHISGCSSFKTGCIPPSRDLIEAYLWKICIFDG